MTRYLIQYNGALVNNNKMRTLKQALKGMGFSKDELAKSDKIETWELETRIKELWRKRALQLHPDITHTDGEEFKQLTHAYHQAKKLLPRHHARIYEDVWAYTGRTYFS